MEYRYRYPRDFDVFKPSLEPGESVSQHDADSMNKLNNTYDNSILYTDYFLSEIIAAIKSSGRPVAGMIYLSDHGEDLYDDGCANFGHGKATLAAVRIPLFVWLSPGYQTRFAVKTANLQKHRGEPLTSKAVFPTLLDMAGLHFPGEDQNDSAASSTFVRPSPRVVWAMLGQVDIDQAHPNKDCQLTN
jgi:glucan phosphoethanolaminetransferase (alkaline phosphatase superfamily)